LMFERKKKALLLAFYKAWSPVLKVDEYYYFIYNVYHCKFRNRYYINTYQRL